MKLERTIGAIAIAVMTMTAMACGSDAGELPSATMEPRATNTQIPESLAMNTPTPAPAGTPTPGAVKEFGGANRALGYAQSSNGQITFTTINAAGDAWLPLGHSWNIPAGTTTRAIARSGDDAYIFTDRGAYVGDDRTTTPTLITSNIPASATFMGAAADEYNVFATYSLGATNHMVELDRDTLAVQQTCEISIGAGSIMTVLNSEPWIITNYGLSNNYALANVTDLSGTVCSKTDYTFNQVYQKIEGTIVGLYTAEERDEGTLYIRTTRNIHYRITPAEGTTVIHPGAKREIRVSLGGDRHEPASARDFGASASSTP